MKHGVYHLMYSLKKHMVYNLSPVTLRKQVLKYPHTR